MAPTTRKSAEVQAVSAAPVQRQKRIVFIIGSADGGAQGVAEWLERIHCYRIYEACYYTAVLMGYRSISDYSVIRMLPSQFDRRSLATATHVCVVENNMRRTERLAVTVREFLPIRSEVRVVQLVDDFEDRISLYNMYIRCSNELPEYREAQAANPQAASSISIHTSGASSIPIPRLPIAPAAANDWLRRVAVIGTEDNGVDRVLSWLRRNHGYLSFYTVENFHNYCMGEEHAPHPRDRQLAAIVFSPTRATRERLMWYNPTHVYIVDGGGEPSTRERIAGYFPSSSGVRVVPLTNNGDRNSLQIRCTMELPEWIEAAQVNPSISTNVLAQPRDPFANSDEESDDADD
jgi:hypothetical protein